MTTPKKPENLKKNQASTVSSETYSWKDHKRSGSKFSKELESKMIAKGGCKKRSKNSDNEVVLVHYDREYILAKICYHLFSKIESLSLEDTKKLIEEAYDYYESGEYELIR